MNPRPKSLRAPLVPRLVTRTRDAGEADGCCPVSPVGYAWQLPAAMRAASAASTPPRPVPIR